MRRTAWLAAYALIIELHHDARATPDARQGPNLPEFATHRSSHAPLLADRRHRAPVMPAPSLCAERARLSASLRWIRHQEVTTVNSPSPERPEIPDTLASAGPRCLDGLRALQQIQRLYDDDMWDIDHPAHSKVRHIHIHLSSTTGRLAALIEPADHDAFHRRDGAPADTGAVAKLIADLVMHAAQLANAFGVDLDSALASRYRNNAQRFAPESAFADFAADSR